MTLVYICALKIYLIVISSNIYSVQFVVMDATHFLNENMCLSLTNDWLTDWLAWVGSAFLNIFV